MNSSFASIKTDSLRFELRNLKVGSKDYVSTLMSLSKSYYHLPDSSIHYINEVLNYIANDKSKDLALAYHIRGYNYKSKGMPDEAIEDYFQAIDLYRQLDYNGKVAHIMLNIGYLSRESKVFDKSLEYYQGAIEILKDHEDDQLLGDAYEGLGYTYYKMKLYDDALQFYLQARSIYEDIDSEYDLMNITNDIGLYYNSKGEFLDAIKSFHATLEYAIRLEDKKYESWSYNNLGWSYLELSNYDSSKYYLFKSLEIKSDMGFDKDAFATYYNLGLIEYKKGNFEKAEEFLLSNVNCSCEVIDYDILLDTYTLLKNIKKEEGNIEMALNYADDYQDLIASNEFQKNRLIAETSKNKIEKVHYKREVLLASRTANRSKSQIISSAVVVTLALLFFFLHQYREKKRKQSSLQNIRDLLDED